MKRRYILPFVLLVCCIAKGFSQMVGDNVFLQGRYVEIGVAPNGGYGSTLPAPATYHPNLGGVTFNFWDPAAGSATTSGNFLGFVADYGADGWTVGTPPYFGDFYLPGHPQEGWAIESNAAESHAYIPSYQYFSGPPLTGFTGTLAGTNVGYVSSGGVARGIWQGSAGGLSIRQTTILDTTKLYFTVNVVLTNTTAVPISNIYYIRTVDPDNEETRTGVGGGGSYTTVNTIDYQLPNPGNKVLVSTTGVTYTNAYLGLGTIDCRAKCTIFNGGLDPGYSLDSLWHEVPVGANRYTVGTSYVSDVGIALDFNIGTIAPGDSTSLSYAYILNASYIDSALNSTQPVFSLNDTPVVGLSDTINLCTYPGDSIVLSIQNGGFYHWRWLPDSFLASPTGISNTVHSDSITTNITYTITGTSTSGGCDSLQFFVHLVHGTFPGPAVTPVSYCQHDVAVPLAPSGPGYTWWTVPVGGSGSSTPPTPSTAIPGTTLYYLTQQVGLCQSLRSPDTVIIKALPPAPLIAGPNPYCQNQPFVPFTTVGTGILWYSSPTGGIGSTVAPTVNTSIPGTDTFYASQTVNGCEGEDRGSIAITVLDSIKPHFDYTIHYGCKGDTVLFNNTSYGGKLYHWQFGDGHTDTAANPKHVYITQDTFLAKLTAINQQCEDSIVEKIPLVHPLHAAFGVAPQIVCQKNPVAFTDSSFGTGISYRWFFGNGATDSVPNTSQVYINAGVYDAKLVVTDFVPCTDTASVLVYVDSTTEIGISLTDSVICRNSYATFTGKYTSIGNIGVVWDFGDGDSIKNVNPVSHAFDVVGTHTVTVTSHYRVCRDTGMSRSFVIFPAPSIHIGDDTSICPGSNAIILSDSYNKPSEAHWKWTTGETTQSIKVTAPGHYGVTVNVSGCYSSDTVFVKNDCYMDIPNVFTPNGDGLNDYFFPRQFLTSGLIAFHMEIYNRWGQQIFESNSLDGAGWDGKFNNTRQPEGVYVYIIDGRFKDGQKEHHQGNVTLLR